MRRISIGLTLVLFVPSIASADYVVPLRHRVQFSPYAFSYHNNGLVPGGVAYTPYAFGPSNTGLVFEGVRYTPYAFTYRNRGLILDYYWYPVSYVACNHPCSSDQVCSRYGSPSRCNTSSRTYDTTSKSRCYSQGQNAATQSATTACAQTEDTLTIIRQHLRERGYSHVGVNRILRIGDRLVSADFTVGSGNLLVKYWDPAQIESVSAKADGNEKPTSSTESRLLDKYKRDWEVFAGKYQQDGGEIYVVAASERTEIVAALDACPSLTPAGTKPGPEAVYARQ